MSCTANAHVASYGLPVGFCSNSTYMVQALSKRSDLMFSHGSLHLRMLVRGLGLVFHSENFQVLFGSSHTDRGYTFTK